MKIIKFRYTKQVNEVVEITNREALILHSSKDYYSTIDLSKLSDKEIETLLKIQEEYEDKMKPYYEKALRNFSRDKMEIVE